MPTYEIEATFEAGDDDETPEWVEQKLRSMGCTDVFVTVVDVHAWIGGGQEGGGR